MARSASRRRRTSRSRLAVELEAGSPLCIGTSLEGLAAATELAVPREIEVGVGVGVEVARPSGARQSCTARWVAVEAGARAGAAIEAAVCGVAALEGVVGICVDDRHEGGVARSAPLELASVVDDVGGRFDTRASIAAPATAAVITRAPPIFAPSDIHPAALAVVVTTPAPVALARIALLKRS